jgi:hypothetical protein
MAYISAYACACAGDDHDFAFLRKRILLRINGRVDVAVHSWCKLLELDEVIGIHCEEVSRVRQGIKVELD